MALRYQELQNQFGVVNLLKKFIDFQEKPVIKNGTRDCTF